MSTKLLPKKQLILLHFQPLEKYPPVMNFIDSAAELQDFEVIVFTTTSRGNNWFKNENCRIHRLGWGIENRFVRLLTYISFNIFVALWLFVFKPGLVFYYETLSSFPAYCYAKLYKKFRLFIHYHEYVSPEERKKFSGYVRFLLKMESDLLRKAIWISQTNPDRCDMFYKDFPFLDKSKLQQMPNYPPFSWIKTNALIQLSLSAPLRIVYIGSVGMDTMYTREFANWVVSKHGEVIWDLYSDQYDSDVVTFFKKINSPFIQLKRGVRYFDLPVVLKSYHIGVVLYKGHIPNYIYNVPNKLVEYLVCGLEVWCPQQMKSVHGFKDCYPDAQIVFKDFKSLDQFSESKSRMNASVNSEYKLCITAENSFQPLLNLMQLQND